MKTKLITAAILFCFLLVGISSAQPTPPSKEKMLKHLVEKLELTKAQAKKVESILNSFHEKMFEKKELMRREEEKIMNASDEEISKLLTETQKKKFEEIKKEREMRRPPMDKGKGLPQKNKPLN